jgi:hypothetical protein
LVPEAPPPIVPSWRRVHPPTRRSHASARFGHAVALPTMSRPSKPGRYAMLARAGAGHFAHTSWAAVLLSVHIMFSILIFFLFQKQFRLDLNFQNSYQIQFSSKNHETGSIILLYSCCI